MLRFTYTEEGGRDIEMTYNDYPSFEEMCSMFVDFVAARGYDKEELAYAFADEAFEDIPIDSLCEEWQEDAQRALEAKERGDVQCDLDVINVTIDALAMSDKYYVRRKLK